VLYSKGLKAKVGDIFVATFVCVCVCVFTVSVYMFKILFLTVYFSFETRSEIHLITAV
jgi:hypothetical protein